MRHGMFQRAWSTGGGRRGAWRAAGLASAALFSSAALWAGAAWRPAGVGGSTNRTATPEQTAAPAPFDAAPANAARFDATRFDAAPADAPRAYEIRLCQYGPACPSCPTADAACPLAGDGACGPGACGAHVCGLPPCAPPRRLSGVDSADCSRLSEPLWGAWKPIPWEAFAHGEYAGPARCAHVPEYHLRVDDLLEFVYRLTREQSQTPYQLNVGDEIRVESITDKNLDRDLVIQPDGTVTLRLLGQVSAARRTVEELRADLEQRYLKFYKVPSITVTPLKVNTRLEDLRAAVDSRFGAGGQSRQARVTPEGTVQLVGIGSAPAQGLTLRELKLEIDARYAELVDGIEVTPVLVQRAPRFIYVVGEVGQSGRFTLEGPTTALQAIALAGSWRQGANLREVVVFRRAEDWRLLATRLDLRGALLGKRPSPADEIWLRDGDIVVVPKTPLQIADELIEMVFTRGIYGVVPFQGISIAFAKASTI